MQLYKLHNYAIVKLVKMTHIARKLRPSKLFVDDREILKMLR